MKKTVFNFVLIAGVVVFLSSCISVERTYYKFLEDGMRTKTTQGALVKIPGKTFKLTVDDSISKDGGIIITFVNDTYDGWFIVKEWNGKDIEVKLYGKKGDVWSDEKSRLTVPAGNNSFIFDANFGFSNRFKDVELKYNLEDGKEYQVKGTVKSLGRNKGSELFVGIYDVTKKSTLLKEWKLGETGK